MFALSALFFVKNNLVNKGNQNMDNIAEFNKISPILFFSTTCGSHTLYVMESK
jgi:hypothetical protein